MRYCVSFCIKGLQNCKRSRLDVRKKDEKMAYHTVKIGKRGSITIIFELQTLTSDSFAAPFATWMHSASFERQQKP